MKKFLIKHKILIIVSALAIVALISGGFFLFGINHELAEVENVKVDDDAYLRWNKVEGASRYVVNINGVAYETEKTQLDVFNIFTRLGVYEIEVVAYSSFADVSPSFSQIITYDVNLDGINCTVQSNRCVLTVADKEKLSPILVIPNAIDGVSVSSLGMFEECDNLGSVYIYDEVKTRNYSFKGCKNLKRVRLSTSVSASAFLDCTSLYDVVLTGGTSIGEQAFRGCVNLKSLFLPDTFTKIYRSAFWGCIALETIDIPKKMSSIESMAFAECSALESMSIPENVELLYLDSFKGCWLKSLYIPSSVKEIIPYGISAESLIVSQENPWFYSENNCIIDKNSEILISGSISSDLSFPEHIIGEKAFFGSMFDGDLYVNAKEIGEKAFYACNKLKSITIGEDVQTIRSWAFCGNLSVENLTILDGVKKIESVAFMECPSIKTLHIPASVEEIEEQIIGSSGSRLEEITVSENNAVYYSSGNCIMRKSDKYLMLGCVSSNIPEDTLAIGRFAFQLCDIEELIVPDGVVKIDVGAFFGCQKIERVEIPGTVEIIDVNAFQCCINLRELILHEGIKEIRAFSFAETVNLHSIIIPESAIGGIQEKAFSCGPIGNMWTDIPNPNKVKYTDRQLYCVANTSTSSVVISEIAYDGDYAYVSSIKFDSKTMMHYSNKPAYLNAPPVRKGYKFLGFSLTKKSLNVDFPVTEKIPIEVEYTLSIMDGPIKIIGGQYRGPIVEIPESTEDGTVLYAVWQKNE